MAFRLSPVAFNWAVYDVVTKNGVVDACENSTSAGSSDVESEGADYASPAGSASPRDRSDDGDYALAATALLRALRHAQTLALVPPRACGWGDAAVKVQVWPQQQPQQSWGPAAPAKAPGAGRQLRQKKKRQRVLCRLAARGSAQVAAGQVAPEAALSFPQLLDSPRTGSESSLPHDYPPPPGLVLAPPPGLPPPPVAPAAKFDVTAFRRVLVATLRELAVAGSVTQAVQRIRQQAVPREQQAAEFADILTRAAEEQYGSSRGRWWAFAVGLCGGVDAPGGRCFGMSECSAGLELFFQDIYPVLCLDTRFNLPGVMKDGLVPTLQSVFPMRVLEDVLPPDLLSP